MTEPEEGQILEGVTTEKVEIIIPKREEGRPTVMTDVVLQKLEQGFLMGFNDTEACLYANIAPSTLYKYQENNPEFAEKKNHLRENPKMIAKTTVYNRLGRDPETAKWYLERKSKDEFSPRAELTGKDGKDIMPKPITDLPIHVPEHDGNS